MKTYVIFFGEFDTRSARAVIRTDNKTELENMVDQMNRMKIVPPMGLATDVGSWDWEEVIDLNELPTAQEKLYALIGL